MAPTHDVPPTIYPAFCFKASPTHFAWVKMAAADVHRLHRPRGFEGQKIFFYKNHPIRFVSVVGVIVARNEIARRTILTLDDSSGATLEVVIQQVDPNELAGVEADPKSEPVPKQPHQQTNTASFEEFSVAKLGVQPMKTVHVSTTDRSILDISQLVPQATVKIKGTLSQFRSVMQVQLERFTLVPDTNAEMQFVDERLQFLVQVLSVPWFLEEDEIERLRLDAEEGGMKVVEERKKAERRVKRRIERVEKDQRHILKRYEREERMRAKEASLCKKDGARVMQSLRRRVSGERN